MTRDCNKVTASLKRAELTKCSGDRDASNSAHDSTPVKEARMDISVNKDAISALFRIVKQPIMRQLDFLMKPWTTGQVLRAPWDPEPASWTQGLAQAYLERLAIERQRS
jgi:hypothetical protein